jgi:hypothetical protein
VFLDIPAGTQFERWYDSLPKELRIFVYDHHDLGRQIVNFPPRFLQYATENIAKLPPTCLFSHQIYTAFLKSEPTWLVYVGLLGEGQISRYSEYVIDWSFAKELVTLVAHGVLRDDNLVLEYLVSHLSAGAQPPDPMFNDKMVELRKTSTQVSRAIREATEKVLLNGDETIIVRLVSSEYQIANYVSSKARHSRPDSLIVVGEHISNGTICADLRTGRRLKIDLRPIINEAKQSGLLLGGGGHPAAVGVRLKADKWQPFIDFLKGKIS